MKRMAVDVMQRDVVSVSPDATLAQVQRILYEEEISGAPVVDETGQVVGVISVADLLRAASDTDETPPIYPAYLFELLEFSPGEIPGGEDGFTQRLEERRVADFMTVDLCSVPPDASVAEVARVLRENRIHRVLVLERGELYGVISTFDLLGELEKRG
jgi:CBS domain-containing protein